MQIDSDFSRDEVIYLDAAVIGLGRHQWTAVDPSTSLEHARELMQNHRFDILPIEGADRIVAQYFCTSKWHTYDRIERRQISRQDVLSMRISVRSLIEAFADSGKHFFFLCDDSDRVEGFVSEVHLNGRHVRIYLFSLLSKLEIQLSKFVARHVNEKELLKLRAIQPEAKGRFVTDRENDQETELMEYLYLSDLIKLVRTKDLTSQLEFRSKSQFEAQMNPLNELRNQTAHPTRSLVTTDHTVARLWEKLQTIEQVTERLVAINDELPGLLDAPAIHNTAIQEEH